MELFWLFQVGLFRWTGLWNSYWDQWILNIKMVKIKHITVADPGGVPPARAPPRVEILSFWHTNFTKRSRLGSWRPPYGKSWIRYCITSTLLAGQHGQQHPTPSYGIDDPLHPTMWNSWPHHVKFMTPLTHPRTFWAQVTLFHGLLD